MTALVTTTIIKEPQCIITVLVIINIVFLAQRALQHSNPKNLEQAVFKELLEDQKSWSPPPA